MLVEREKRIAPGRDDKVITGWNGMMIHALTHAGSAFQQPEWIAMAERAARFILENMRSEPGMLSRSWNHGTTRGHGGLEDYTFLAEGLVELYTATANRTWLDTASELVEYARTHFRHDSGIGFYDTDDAAERLISRPREVTDTATPSGNGMMAEMLFVLAVMKQKMELIEEATAVIESMARPMTDHPLFMGQFLSVAERIVESPRELVLAGDPASERVTALRKALASSHEPTLVIGYNDPADSDAASHFPMLADRPSVDGGAAYVCQDFACRPPVTTPEELMALLNA
jgi:uncharacterized protein YyaL (SSP411 family)